ncbi:MAG: SapC family protein [Alphaproteobacteria bacterium]|nr:SapC family protein [Alphaproteobacteria bacterium]
MTSVLFNNVDHHDLRVIARGGAEFGDAVNQVMVFPTEFEIIQREFPIVLRPDPEGRLRPVALLGLARDENLFLDPEEGWRSAAIPALLQRGPFSIAAPPDDEAEPMIRIDTDHPRLSREEGEPLFLPHGGKTRYLEGVMDALRAIYIGNPLLDPMAEALTDLELLQPVNLELQVAEGEAYAISDAQTIDRARLAALGAAGLETLHRAGFLHSAFMIAASLANLQRLVDMKSAARQPHQAS